MITDEETKLEGMKALVAALGNMQAERFIALVMRDSFYYAKWQEKLWVERSIVDISQEAMRMRELQEP